MSLPRTPPINYVRNANCEIRQAMIGRGLSCLPKSLQEFTVTQWKILFGLYQSQKMVKIRVQVFCNDNCNLNVTWSG